MKLGGRSVTVVLICAALLAPGCVAKKYPDKSRYLIEPATPAAARSLEEVVRLERVRVSPLYDSKGFVYRLGSGRYETDYYNEFYAFPGTMFGEVILDWLREAHVFSELRGPDDPAPTNVLLAARIDRLHADLSDRKQPRAVLAMTFELRRADAKAGGGGEALVYESSVPTTGSQPQALLDGWSAALTEILRRLARDLRA